jgi:hypothetical protein
MNKSINTIAVNKVFADADGSQAGFATRLFNLGVFSRKEAQPHVIAYILQAPAYKGCKAYEGQRGLTFTKDTAPHAAMNRILDNCFEKVKTPSTAKKTDAVKALLTRYTALSAAEKRRFLASI